MKKIILLFLVVCVLTSCGIMGGDYPLTFFIVKNTSDKPISFTADVIKQSQIAGPQTITRAFTVKPNDSVIARQTYFKTNGENPQYWFSEFNIMPVEGIEMNNPKLSGNWVNTSIYNSPSYTFTLNKDE